MKNSKFEYRNPKQFQIIKIINSKQVLIFEHLDLDIVSNLVLRASNL
jgi:hypothetical protein